MQHRTRKGIALLGFFLHIVESVKHQQRVLQPLCGNRRQRGIIEQIKQRFDVITALHRAQQLGSALTREQRTVHTALGDGSQERRLHLGGIIDAGRHTVGE